MEQESQSVKNLIIENEELRRNLALALNKPLLIKINSALERINSGNYISEEEFFK